MHNGNFSDYIIDLATNYGLGTWDFGRIVKDNAGIELFKNNFYE